MKCDHLSFEEWQKKKLKYANLILDELKIIAGSEPDVDGWILLSSLLDVAFHISQHGPCYEEALETIISETQRELDDLTKDGQ